MSIFLCARCREYRDSDDGCEEFGMYDLVCQDCVDERADDEWENWEPEGVDPGDRVGAFRND